MLNIILSFLSTVRVDKSSQQVDVKDYPELDSDGIGYTHTTNESGLRYIMQLLKSSGQRLDYYIAMNSSAVENDNVGTAAALQLTHYQYFQRRLQLCLDAYYGTEKLLAGNIVRSIHYYENTGIDESLNSVIEAVSLIKKLQQEAKDDRRVQLFLDLSGGPRDANMLLLIISRLLEYDPDITMHEVICSALGDRPAKDEVQKGRVQLISRAYSLLDLVAGMAEFANFGSVNSLESYFKTQKTITDPALDKLLKTMHDFSDKIKLCRYGEFKAVIERLQQSIQSFKRDAMRQQRDSQIVLSFMQQLEQKYQPLFAALQEASSRKQDLSLIRWCNANDMIQQAMTLITERFPLYIFDTQQPLLHVSDGYSYKMKTDYDNYLKKEKGAKADYKYWLLSICRYKGGIDVRLVKEKLYNAFNNCLNDTVKPDGKPVARLQQVVQQLLYKNYFCGTIDIKLAEKNLQELHEFFNNCADKQFVYEYHASHGIEIAEKLLRLTGKEQLALKRILNQLIAKKDITDYQGKIILKNDIENILDFAYIKVADDSKGNYARVYAAVKQGILETNYDKDEVLRALHAYFLLKDERNAINHAHDEQERVSFADLKQKISLIVDVLEKLSA